MSIEFNLLYRWHACISQQDTAWTEQLFKTLFPGKEWDKVWRTPLFSSFPDSAIDHHRGLPRGLSHENATWPRYQNLDLRRVSCPGNHANFGTQALLSLERGLDGSFKDADIANYLLNATESAASAFKARGIPSALKVIEVMGIEQGRTWGACSINEFRKFVGLKREAHSCQTPIQWLTFAHSLRKLRGMEPGPGDPQGCRKLVQRHQ